MTDLITKAREQAQRRSLSLATRDLLNGLCDALEKAQAEVQKIAAGYGYEYSEAVRELVRVGLAHWNDTKGAPYENI
jgi:hypothetical protein